VKCDLRSVSPIPLDSSLVQGTLDMLVLKTLVRGTEGIAGSNQQISEEVLLVEEGSL